MTAVSEYSKVTPELEQLAQLCLSNSSIDPQDYARYDVKRGLRDLNGNGVVAGLTEVSEVYAKEKVDGCPSTLKEGVSKEEAEEAKKQLTEAGAVVEVK